MQLEQFLEKLPDNYSALDIEQIEKAYHLAEKAHKGQTLASGLPYISHCASVALILAELTVPPELIITGLLHDVVEVTKRMTNFELSETLSFMNNYMAALFLPHTNMEQFPKLKARLETHRALRN